MWADGQTGPTRSSSSSSLYDAFLPSWKVQKNQPRAIPCENTQVQSAAVTHALLRCVGPPRGPRSKAQIFNKFN